MDYLRTFFRLLTRLSRLPGRFIRFFRSDPRSRQRPPELAELEAQFYQDAGQDPERVRSDRSHPSLERIDVHGAA